MRRGNPNATRKEVDLAVKNIVETLQAVVTDNNQSDADRDCAAAILKYLAQEMASDHICDQAGAKSSAWILWTFPEKYVVASVTDKEGIARLVRQEIVVDSTPLPPPGPVPTAVPSPVLPTAFEVHAVAELHRRLDRESSTVDVEARLREIEKEAQQLRAIRDQNHVTTAVGSIEITADAEVEQIKRDAVRPLSVVAQIESDLDNARDVKERYAEAQENLLRLKRLRDESLPR